MTEKPLRDHVKLTENNEQINIPKLSTCLVF